MATHQDPYLQHKGKTVKLFYDDLQKVRKKEGTLKHVGAQAIQLNDKHDGAIIINKQQIVRLEVKHT